jgi:hypothetical protein
MKILSINYPKQIDDEKKLAHFNKNYETTIMPVELKKSKEFQIAPINTKEQKLGRAGPCK